MLSPPRPSLTAESSRAARALLNWSMRDAAAASGLSLGAVNRLEGGRTASRGATAEKLIQAFRRGGVQIVAGEGLVGAVLVLDRRRAP